MVDLVHSAGRLSDRRWRGVSRIVAILGCAALGACAALDEMLAPQQPQPEPAAAVEEAPPPVAAPLPRAPRPRPARVARLPSPSPQPSAAPQPEPEPEAESIPTPEIRLLGMSRGEAATTLGAPLEERDSAPAKIWKYANADCAVELYFYLDVARNDFYALHYYVHNSNGAMAGEAADRCLQRIYSENHR